MRPHATDPAAARHEPSPGPSLPARRRELALDVGTFALVAALVCAVYWRAIAAPFIFDDRLAIVDNPSIVRLWPLIGDAERRGPLNPPGLAPTARRPLVNLSFALNHHFNRLEPAPYRMVNLFVHVLSAVVLAAIVRRTLCLPYFGGGWPGAARPLSLAIALLWALHPLNTEAVVYVTQRTELFGAFFYLLTFWAAVRHWSASSAAARNAWLVVAILSYLAGIASKEIVVSAPLVLLLYERIFLVDSLRAAARRSWPLYAGLALGWLLLIALNASGVTGLTDARHRLPVHVWWMSQAKVLLLYLKLAVWPWPLSIHYAPAYLRTFGDAWPWLAAVAVAGIVAAIVARRRPPVGFVVAAVVLTLAPTLVVPLPKMIAAERRMYLPLAGLVTLAVVGGYRLLSAHRPAARGGPALVAVATLIVVASAVSVVRLAAYQSAVTIWRDAVVHQPDDPMARYNLGVALIDEGRPPQDAMTHFEDALRLDPEHTGALDNLGMALNALGRPQEAVTQFQRALTLEPDDVVARNNVGAVLTSLGRPHEAVSHLRVALSLRPDEPKPMVHLNLGKALLATGQVEDGVTHLADAVRLRPDDAEMYEAVATALLRAGEMPRAVEYYRGALALRPDYFEARNNLGAALLASGHPEQAIAELETALRAKPDHANARYNLASALLTTGRPRDAITQFQAVLRSSPSDARARFQCATAYARADEPAAARAMAEEALALARSQGDGALADEIAAWLATERVAPSAASSN